MGFKSVISRTGKKIALAALAIVCGAAIGVGAWILKGTDLTVEGKAEESSELNSEIQLFETAGEEIVTNETLGVSGVTFNGYSDTWSKEFNCIFNGDTEIEYAFPAKVAGLWNNVDLFDFVVKKTDGTELFTVRKGITWTANSDDWRNSIQLFANGTAYSKKTEQAAPYDSGNKAGALYISSMAEGTAVYYTNNTGAKTLLGKFDGVSAYETNALPKIDLPENGYKIELKDAMNKDGHSVNTAPLITKINGISVVDGKVNTQTITQKLGLSGASEATYTGNSKDSDFEYSGTKFSVANGVATTLAPEYAGDTFEMKYSIPVSDKTAGAGIALRLDDLSGNEIVTLNKYVSEWKGADAAGKVGGSHAYTHKMTVKRNDAVSVSEDGAVGSLPFLGQSTTLGTLKFEFKDNALNIYSASVQNPYSTWDFAWSYYNEYKKVCTIEGVAKPANGYKISFAGLNGAATILINSINGEECTGVAEDKAEDFSVDISAAGESANESGVAALNLKRGENPSFTATVKNAKFAGVTLNEYAKPVDISSLDLSEDKTVDISYLGVTKTYAVNVYDYVVTLNDGENQTKQYLEANEKVAFAEGAQADKTFIGYANESGELYGVASEYTPTQDIVFNAAYIDFAMHKGASVRKQTDENNQYGMRFLAGIAEADLEAYGGFITETGVLILPENLRNNKEITLDNFSAENKEILKIVNEGNEFAKDVKVKDFEGYGVYTGVITSILKANINRKFSARGYAVITYSDGKKATIYTAFNVDDHSRSAYEVAKAAKDAGETGAALDYYVSAVEGNN